jgi:hypothetical protein
MNQDAKPHWQFPTSFFCLVCYFLSCIALALAVLPADAFAIAGGHPQAGTWRISLTMAGVFMAFGAVLHIVFYRLNPERFDMAALRWALLCMLILLALMFGMSIALSRATGLPAEVLKARVDRVLRWLGMAVFALAILLIPGIVVLLYAAVHFRPCNRMARRLAVNDAAGAIRIGESRTPSKRDFGTNLNLVAAYAMAQRLDHARALLAELESAGWKETIGPEEQYCLMMEHLRSVTRTES